MGFLNKLFGKKSASPAQPEKDKGNAASTVDAPPEFIKAVELQKAYWKHQPEEQANLEQQGFNQLNWRERLRLHHLNCLDMLNAGPQRSAAKEKCCQNIQLLLGSESPFRPRSAMVWQGESAQPETEREPDQQGVLLNPSVTHFGSLEVLRLDPSNKPIQIDFVSFDELTGIMFGPQSMFRVAKLFFEDGRNEIVYIPLLYGLTSTFGNEFDRAGKMTRFLGPVSK